MPAITRGNRAAIPGMICLNTIYALDEVRVVYYEFLMQRVHGWIDQVSDFFQLPVKKRINAGLY